MKIARLAQVLDEDFEIHKMSGNGLSTRQAEEILKTTGENSLQAKKKSNALRLFAGQFKDLMVLVLLASTVISVFMGDITEAISIITIVFINAVLGFLQEFRTEKTIEMLKKMSAPTAHVYRDGQLQTIEASQIVPGDVVEIEAGDKVPADLQLLSCNRLAVDESILTGETVAVDKESSQTEHVPNEPHRSDLAYMGTIVTTGNGRGRVIATGMRTQMGQVASMLDDIQEEDTPLQKRLGELGKIIVIGCLVICVIVTITGIIKGEEFYNMLITGISLGVAAIPEGLPATVTIALALAVRRMLKHKALVRKLNAVETLGCASVICTDKTGTLTENKMTVKTAVTASDVFQVTGNGYQIAGAFESDGRIARVSTDDVLQRMLHIGILCNHSEVYAPQQGGNRNREVNSTRGEYRVSGDPTEVALLIAAGKANISRQELSGSYTLLNELPFDSRRKCMSVQLTDRKGICYSYVKGAFDVLLKRCTQVLTPEGVRPMTPSMLDYFRRESEKMAQGALRVLAFAYKQLGGTSFTESECENGLIFVGLMGMSDPPKAGVKRAVRTCQKAGIKAVMITGDYKLTACAIGKEIGIYHKGDLVVTGEELAQMDDAQLDACIGRISVFARVNPSDKLRIVRAFKRKGHIVAMTGDGVNDAPSIKEADVGVSMGISGTDVAKEASDIILTDDNFATLVSAVEQGRVIYSNIRKFIRYLLSCNIGEVITMFVGILMGMPVVLLPIQILLVNLATDGLPAIALGFEPAEKGIMSRRPRRPDESIFSGGLLSKIIFRGLLIGLTTLGVFVMFLNSTHDVSTARTGAFLTLVMTQLIHVFECKCEDRSIFTIPVWNNLKLIGAVLVSIIVMLCVIYIPVLQPVFHTVALTGKQVGSVFVFSMLVPIGSALFHFIGRKQHSRTEARFGSGDGVGDFPEDRAR